MSRRAAVIGGGLLGLEAARGIAAQGCPVTVVHLLDRLMERQLDAGASALLAPALARPGQYSTLSSTATRSRSSGRSAPTDCASPTAPS